MTPPDGWINTDTLPERRGWYWVTGVFINSAFLVPDYFNGKEWRHGLPWYWYPVAIEPPQHWEKAKAQAWTDAYGDRDG